MPCSAGDVKAAMQFVAVHDGGETHVAKMGRRLWRQRAVPGIAWMEQSWTLHGDEGGYVGQWTCRVIQEGAARHG